MHLELMRDRAKTFPAIGLPSEIRKLRVWHCKYKSLRALAEFEELEELVIATFPDDSLEALASLGKLRSLSILHMPRVTSLEALARMERIESLSLATSPAWDAAGKCTIVSSLEPLTKMRSLRHMELFGVCPPDKSLAVLAQCKKLQTARFSQYTKDEVERFYKTSGVANKFNPTPTF
jgi:hypothetical protein